MLSQAYWKLSFTHTKPLADAMRMDDVARQALFQETVRMKARDRTPWSVCEECGEMFVFDRDVARAHAVSNTKPPVRARWTPTDACCSPPRVGAGLRPLARERDARTGRRRLRPLREADVQGRVGLHRPPDRMAELRAHGVLDAAPAAPPRPDRDGWLACHVCAARLFARAHRAGLTAR
ncbi:hypothetical protein NKH77_18550 [Streptomyces sp. M19]